MGPRWGPASLWGSRTRPPVLTWALGGSLVFADKAAKDGPTPDSLLGEVGGRVVGPGRVELAAAMGHRFKTRRVLPYLRVRGVRSRGPVVFVNHAAEDFAALDRCACGVPIRGIGG